MSSEQTTAAPDPVREEQLRIQALGAAISRRDWHAAEQAHAAIRDEFDRRPRAMQEAMSAQGGGEERPVAWRWEQHMHDSMSGWEQKHEAHPPGSYVKDEDIRDLTPLYARPAPEVKDAAAHPWPQEDLGDGRWADVDPAVLAAAQPTTPAPAAASEGLVERPRVITLCGSSRFPEAFHLANAHLSMQGHVVISLGLYGHADEPTGARFLTSDGNEATTEKAALDQLHFRKIDLCDSIFVVNVGGYIGSSTKREIEYAQSQGKDVEFMFPAAARIEADAAVMERKDAALLKAFEYIGGARGTALALAMSGPDNPKLDSGLMKLHDDGLRVEQEVRAALRPEAKGGREDVE